MPHGDESKKLQLLRALADLWALHPREKIVVFTTYLGSVDSLRAAIEARIPGHGVDVLKGGDHGAKVAAERRFRKPDGPRVLICTAAGREGINLQFARVLFNHDLPWNPMDLEQRIGRIHRYGQAHTAQVYNLVSADTIEGEIFLLLEEKLLEIAKALGKVDELGQVTEDLRGQILGQLSERLSYDKLYQDAVKGPTLRRTRQELEVALENARMARQVVFELFQDLEGFRLDDYKQFDDGGQALRRLLAFVREAVRHEGGVFQAENETTFKVSLNGDGTFLMTTDRDAAKRDEKLTLLGLEHPLVRRLIDHYRELPSTARALAGRLPRNGESRGAISTWQVQAQAGKGQFHQRVVTVGLSSNGERSRVVERHADETLDLEPVNEAVFDVGHRTKLVRLTIPEMIRRDLSHAGILSAEGSMSTRLLAWVELS
ncbi:MAG TPA: helicase-related protein [Pirellulales bacterium]|nr:helicase-related protein [Pirellulales bacterium]